MAEKKRVVTPDNMGKGLVWNETTKKYDVVGSGSTNAVVQGDNKTIVVDSNTVKFAEFPNRKYKYDDKILAKGSDGNWALISMPSTVKPDGEDWCATHSSASAGEGLTDSNQVELNKEFMLNHQIVNKYHQRITARVSFNLNDPTGTSVSMLGNPTNVVGGTFKEVPQSTGIYDVIIEPNTTLTFTQRYKLIAGVKAYIAARMTSQTGGVTPEEHQFDNVKYCREFFTVTVKGSRESSIYLDQTKARGVTVQKGTPVSPMDFLIPETKAALPTTIQVLVTSGDLDTSVTGTKVVNLEVKFADNSSLTFDGLKLIIQE